MFYSRDRLLFSKMLFINSGFDKQLKTLKDKLRLAQCFLRADATPVLGQYNKKCSIVSWTLHTSQRPSGWQPILNSWLFRQQAPNLSLLICT